MPDPEPAVLEAPLVEAAGAEPPVPEPETPESVAPPEEPKIDLSPLKGLSAAELRTVLDEADPSAREEIEAELEKRVSQRIQTRENEAGTAETGRHEVYKQYIEYGKRAQADLETRARRFQAGDTEAFSDSNVIAAIDAYRNGALAQVVLENETAVAPVRDQFLPKPTTEEQEKLEKALYEDRRSGKLTQLPVLLELVAARARSEGYEDGIKKGQTKLEGRESLADKVAKIETIRKQSAGITPTGMGLNGAGARATFDKKVAEFKADLNAGRLSQSEQTERRAELDKLAAAIPKE